MIMNTEDVDARLGSPDNLINRLRGSVSGSRSVVSLPAESIAGSTSVTSLPPPVDDLIDDIEDKFNNSRALSGAAKVMAESISLLRDRLPDVDRPEKLARIASDMSKIINNENDKNASQKTFNQVIVYKPILVSESSFGDAIIANE